MHREPLEGQRFGKWIVISFEGCFNHKKSRYICLCTGCGNMHSIRADKLKAGKTLQCADCRRSQMRNH